MRMWISAVVIVVGTLPIDAFSQLYLITGAPMPSYSISFDAGLFQVTEDGSVKLMVDLVPSHVGAEWISVSYEARKAVVLPTDWRQPLVVLDLNRGAVAKECVLPQVGRDDGVAAMWVALVPGIGPMFEWEAFRGPHELSVRGVNLDSALACEDNMATVKPTDILHIEAHGTSGIAETGSWEGTPVGFDGTGRLFALAEGMNVDFDCDQLPATMQKDTEIAWLIINDSRVLVVGVERRTHENPHALIFRKSDRTWRLMRPPGGGIANLRGFGKFISIVETTTKKAISAQHAKGTGSIYINEEVRKKEQSAGRAEWRKSDGKMGPNMEEAFESSVNIYPGRLHLYDVDSERVYTKVTNQGDSEVLLVEDDTLYYRVSDRLYSAPITDQGIGKEHLLATAEAIRDAHWAFIKH